MSDFRHPPRKARTRSIRSTIASPSCSTRPTIARAAGTASPTNSLPRPLTSSASRTAPSSSVPSAAPSSLITTSTSATCRSRTAAPRPSPRASNAPCPTSIVISYQGDGDLAAIGTAEILHAANRGEPITVFFVNNAIYGMTGGQMAPTTPLGAKSTTSPFGRNVWNEGYPLHVSEVLASLEAPVYIERVALGNNKHDQERRQGRQEGAGDPGARASDSRFIEILSPCPTIWKMQPVEAQKWVREELTKIYPLGIFRDRTKDAEAPAPPPPTAPTLAEIRGLLGRRKNDPPPQRRPPPPLVAG